MAVTAGVTNVASAVSAKEAITSVSLVSDLEGEAIHGQIKIPKFKFGPRCRNKNATD